MISYLSETTKYLSTIAASLHLIADGAVSVPPHAEAASKAAAFLLKRVVPRGDNLSQIIGGKAEISLAVAI